jgi:hypothetical protein
MKRLILSLSVVALGLSSCTEDFEDASFRCKIDGDEFIASEDLISVNYNDATNNFYIQATRVANPLSDDLYGEIKLDFSATAPGDIPLDLTNTWRWSNNGGDTYRADGANPGTLTITELDISGKRIAGTFELVATNGSGSTKNVTEGFFDLTW